MAAQVISPNSFNLQNNHDFGGSINPEFDDLFNQLSAQDSNTIDNGESKGSSEIDDPSEHINCPVCGKDALTIEGGITYY